MKVSETFSNPVPYEVLEKFMQAVYDSGLRGDAEVKFNTFNASVGGGRDTQAVAEVTVEGKAHSTAE